MFMPKDSFDEDGPTPSFGIPSDNSSSSGSDMTPAMRKQKMAEMRDKMLNRQKSKGVAAGMIRTGEVPKQISTQFKPSSPTHAGGSDNKFGRTSSVDGEGDGGDDSPIEKDQNGQDAQIFDIATILAENKEDKEKFQGRKNSAGKPINSWGSQENQKDKNLSSSTSAPPTSSASSSGNTGDDDDSTQSNRSPARLGVRTSSDQSQSRANNNNNNSNGNNYENVKKVNSVNELDLSDMKTFLTEPVPRGIVVQCCIQRNKKGIVNKMYPLYELYLEGVPGDTKSEKDMNSKFLMAGKKRSKNKTSNYMISMDKESFDKDAEQCIGKVRSNFVGTEFVIYNKGVNPKDLRGDPASWNLNMVRNEIGSVFYESNVFGSKGPRKMVALIPATSKSGEPVVWKPLKESDSIMNKFKIAKAQQEEEERRKNGDNSNTDGSNSNSNNNNSNSNSNNNNNKDGNTQSNFDPRQMKCTDEYTVLTNKTPKWHDAVGAYVLNFNGRVTMASVKNFQLISTDDQENVLLQFGRVGKDAFTCDFQWPMSPLQAFAICLSSFDYKLACE